MIKPRGHARDSSSQKHSFNPHHLLGKLSLGEGWYLAQVMRRMEPR